MTSDLSDAWLAQSEDRKGPPGTTRERKKSGKGVVRKQLQGQESAQEYGKRGEPGLL